MIGPDIPEHLIKKKQEEKEKEIEEEEKAIDQNEEEEEDIADSFMPELPPDLLPTQPKKKRVMGPAFPPPSSSPNDYQQEDDDNVDDDIVGPSLPTDYDVEQASLNSTVAAIEERARKSEEAMLAKDKDNDKDKKVERAEWMLAPPDVDYLKNANSGRPRSFNQRSVDNSKRDTSSWTDTPADKARKQQQQQQQASSSSKRYDDTRSIKQELDTHKKIQEHNKMERPMSLLEMHRQNKKTNKRKLDEDDPRKRPFDREKDLVSARPMSKKQKAELLEKSNEWSDRFKNSRGGTFL